MGLDVNLYKVLTKAEVTKLKNKRNSNELPYKSERTIFIGIDCLVNCMTNIETLFNFKHCLITQEIKYYNVQAMLLKSGTKTKDSDLSNYRIFGYSFSDKGDGHTKYEISNVKDRKDVIYLDMADDDVNSLDFKLEKTGLLLKDVKYIQRKGIKINKNLTGKCYSDEIYQLFISTEEQLEKLNKNNIYKDCELKDNFKIPKNYLLRLDW